MAVNASGTFQLASITEGSFAHVGNFTDGCINTVDIATNANQTVFAFANSTVANVTCGPSDLNSRYARYFGNKFSGGYYFNATTGAYQVKVYSAGFAKRQENKAYLAVYTKNSAATATSATTATAETTVTTGGASSAATVSSGAASSATTTGAAASSGASASVVPSVTYVAPSNTYNPAQPSNSYVVVAPPKPTASNLYKGDASKGVLSMAAAAIVAFIADVV
ncbi:hypothetical protein BJ741DRAFT_708887 [Chytriomyces cf. hyalinus JEL632]|nr:hypothetical protein BJ741DRAFT_708887 [Chytriomyces cf. hyalinus JEL632]